MVAQTLSASVASAIDFMMTLLIQICKQSINHQFHQQNSCGL